MKNFQPEGNLIVTAENAGYLKSPSALREAMILGKTLEARATVCDSEHNLIVDLQCMKGIIPRTEGAIGISEGTTRDIALISRVNKPVCFKVLRIETKDNNQYAVLSRRMAQEECYERYISGLRNGDIINARVTHLEQFGAFVDIGCGIPSLIPIDAISVSRISHPSDRFSVGQYIKAIVSGENDGKICLTHKELLGTWQQNADLFSAGETVAGTVRSIEEYGIFIELMPNLAGLAERTDFERMTTEERGLFATIRRLFNHALEFLGLKNNELSDRELAYILWCICQDLQSNHLLCKKS